MIRNLNSVGIVLLGNGGTEMVQYLPLVFFFHMSYPKGNLTVDILCFQGMVI